jgi:fluoride exporter
MADGSLPARGGVRGGGGRLPPHPNWRVALGIGFLGAFTTFSTFAYESVKLAEDSAYALAFLNVAGSVVVGLVAAFAGLAVGRAL